MRIELTPEIIVPNPTNVESSREIFRQTVNDILTSFPIPITIVLPYSHWHLYPLLVWESASKYVELIAQQFSPKILDHLRGIYVSRLTQKLLIHEGDHVQKAISLNLEPKYLGVKINHDPITQQLQLVGFVTNPPKITPWQNIQLSLAPRGGASDSDWAQVLFQIVPQIMGLVTKHDTSDTN